jgi:hypothetical protein
MLLHGCHDALHCYRQGFRSHPGPTDTEEPRDSGMTSTTCVGEHGTVQHTRMVQMFESTQALKGLTMHLCGTKADSHKIISACTGYSRMPCQPLALLDHTSPPQKLQDCSAGRVPTSAHDTTSLVFHAQQHVCPSYSTSLPSPP